LKKNKTLSWNPHGQALLSYWNGDKEATIGIQMEDGSITQMPIEIYFRKQSDFPKIEEIALNLCKGTVLDIGAGAGAHCLELQERGFKVLGLDIAPEAVKIMKEQGVKKVVCNDFLTFTPNQTFDTLLFLMNGIGVAGNLEGLSRYLQHAHSMTHACSQLILDSSDLRYNELKLEYGTSYFGEITYQLIFKEEIGNPYQWLYIDQEKLKDLAHANGWLCEIIYEQEDGGYLAQLNKLLP